MPRLALAPLLVPALLAAGPLACTGARDPGDARAVAPSQAMESVSVAGSPPLADRAPAFAVPSAAPAPSSSGAADASAVARAKTAAAADPAPRVAPDMVIRSGRASVQVDSLDAAVARVRQLAARVGGVVANSSLRGGRDQVRTATIEIRVPAPRFEELAAGLEPLGKVETVDVTVEDVGEEYVDVGARVANARRLESRLTDLLAARTGKLSDVLAVERELARVREEIERWEGRLRWLRSRSAVSTLAVTVHEPPPILAGPPSTNPVAHAFVVAWRNFVGVVAGTIAAMGVLVPVTLLGVVGWVGVRRVRRGVRGQEA